MPNVLIDIGKINRTYGGAYQYSIALLRILGASRGNYKFFVYSEKPEEDIRQIVDNSSVMSFTDAPKYSKSRKAKLYTILFNSVNRLLGRSSRVLKKDKYDLLMKKYNIDIVHSPVQSLVKKCGVKSITTLHDVQELHFPEFFTSQQRASRAVRYKKAIDGADAVVVSYNHVKNDIVKYFNKPAENVHVILLDMQNLWFEKLSLKNSKTIKEFIIPENYLLYPASTWEHKNHKAVLESIASFKEQGLQLVCTGHITEYYEKSLKPIIIEKGLQHQVHFLGIVSDDDLLLLYQKCLAVIVPTLYEAGSFPLMESMLMEIPVICSNVTSLPDTLGDERFIFDPNSVEDIIEKIALICYDESYREENIRVIKMNALKLKNNRALEKIKVVYDKLSS